MKQHELSLDSVVFAEMKLKLEAEINETVIEMKAKGLNEGTVAAKIKIGMIQNVDVNGEVHTTVIFEPKITGKICKAREDKCHGTGGAITIGDGGEVLIGSEQVTMDDVMEEGA